MSRLTAFVPFCIVLVATGCAAPPTITPSPPTAVAGATSTADPNAEALTVQLANSEVAVGMERLAFQAVDAQGVPIPVNSTIEVGVFRVEDIAEGQTMSQRTASGTSVRFGDDLPEGGSWVVYHDFDASGPWSIEATVTYPDGHKGTGKARFDVIGRSRIPRVGERPNALDTPAVAEGGDLAGVTGDPEPDPALYAMTVAEAVASGKATVVVLGAPATCTACATVLRELKSVKELYASQVNFIHVESSDLANPDQPSATAAAWGVGPAVPWTFIFDAQGYILTRVEGVIGRNELELLVKRTLGGE